MTLFISPARKRFDENQPLYYPLGRAQKRNALKDFKGLKRKEIKILFLGCHDLGNVLLTIACKKTNDSTLNIHLNHSCPISLARNVLILKVISSPNFNVNCSEDLKYLWDLWYNLEWPQVTLDRFEKDVNELIKTGLPEHNLEFDSNQLKDLKDMWRGWLSSLTKLTKSSEIEKVQKSRLEFINGGGRIGKEMLDYQAKMNKTPEPPILQILTSKLEVAMKITDFPDLLKSKLIKEVQRYYRTGSCNSGTGNGKNEKTLKSVAVNPTLLELESSLSSAKTHRWRVDIYSCPFMGFLPLPLDKLEKNEENIVTLYCQKMLKNLITSYRQLKNCVNFHFYWSDNLRFCLIGTSELFDVIDCSTLADEVGLANLIVSSSPRLDHRTSDALMITESTDGWHSVASSIAGYVEHALCAPLSMIPTLYGVRLATDATLGSNVITTRGNEEGFPEITLTWRQAPHFDNISLGLSPSLELYLKNLEEKCYFMKDETNLDELKSKFFRSYTPLTYCYMVMNLVSHLGNQEDLQNILLKTNFSKKGSQFTLTKRAIEARANQHPLTLVTANQLLTPDNENLLKNHFRAPMLRVMVIPFNRFIEKRKPGSPWIEKNSDVHYIDNFNLQFHGKKAGCVFPTIQLSFVLPKEHGLKPNHCAVIMEMYSSTVMMFLGMIPEMKQETIHVSSSTKKELASCSEMNPRGSFMQAENCQVSPKDFIFNISVHTKDVPKGLYVSSDELRPCEAGHRVTFSLAEPEGVRPLTLCFPHPVLVDSIDATLRRTDRSIRVVLKKALHEPWPYDFNLKPKWDVDRLKLWQESNPKKKDELYFHVANQKGFKQLKNYLGFNIFGNAVHLPEVRLLSPIENARNIIGTILMQVQPDNCEFFEIHKVPAPGQLESVSSTKDIPFFYIRAHPPIITSPFNSPMILLSVLDTRLSEKFVENGHLNAKSSKEDFERIFRPKDKNSKTPMTLWTSVDDSTNLLRYVFRLNSTKMKPSSWQERNLPLGKYSPYLATFVSPLYLDRFPVEIFNSKDQFTCVGCGKKSNTQMKRCSRCKTMTYCTVECQKADWSRHKLMCSEMEPKNLVCRVQITE